MQWGGAILAGALTALITLAVAVSTYNIQSEKDRIERTLRDQEQKFSKLAEELKGIYSAEPEIKIVSPNDKSPIDGRFVEVSITKDSKKEQYQYYLHVPFAVYSIGNAATTGPIWLKIYLESSSLFFGENSTDEPGYGVQATVSSFYNGTEGKSYYFFPGGGYFTSRSVDIQIMADIIPKGKYKVLIKIYYGLSHVIVSKAEAYFEIKADWVKPKEDQKDKDIHPSSNSKE